MKIISNTLYLHAIIIVSLLIFSGKSQAMTMQEFNIKAMPLIAKSGEAENLLLICEQALADATDPDSIAYIRVIKGQAHFLDKDFEAAETEARAVIASGYYQELAHALAAHALMGRGKFEEGLNMCLKGADTEKDEQDRVQKTAQCEELYNQEKGKKQDNIWQAYNKNTDMADRNYRGLHLSFEGTVIKTDDKKGTLTLDVPGQDRKLLCYMKRNNNIPKKEDNKQAEEHTEEMSYHLDNTDNVAQKTSDFVPPEKGKFVRISGTVNGLEGKNLMLVDCSLSFNND